MSVVSVPCMSFFPCLVCAVVFSSIEDHIIFLLRLQNTIAGAGFNRMVSLHAFLSYICALVLCVEAALLGVAGRKLQRYLARRGPVQSGYVVFLWTGTVVTQLWLKHSHTRCFSVAGLLLLCWLCLEGNIPSITSVCCQVVVLKAVPLVATCFWKKSN